MVPFYRRHLPHLYKPGVPVFVTWRLADSLPPNRHFDSRALTTAESFQLMDRLLDETRTGARYLVIPAVAELVSESIWHCAWAMSKYDLHAFSVMPNHVHLLITPNDSLPKILDSLKSFTARRANAFLARSGKAFWASESYDHLVRDRSEFEAARRYVEGNPVRALLVAKAEDYSWSSANQRWARSRVRG
jgi:REP element-mobilizing transposase RayT